MQFLETIGSARRSQSVFSYGVGAIIDFASGSFMPLGLQHMEWQQSGLDGAALEAVRILEPRLAKLLHVKEFRTMPVPGDGQLGEWGKQVARPWSIPAVRFPLWLECPKCHRLGQSLDPFEPQPDGSVDCIGCKVKVNPVRFIVACRFGHIDDFPWVEWAHSKTNIICKQPRLTLKSHGKSGALADLYVSCSCDSSASRGLGDIFKGDEMKHFPCKGGKPWLKLRDQNCGLPVVTLQRGGSNVHFAVTASVLSIPPASEAVAKRLEPEWSWIKSLPDAALEPTLTGFIADKGWLLDVKVAVDWVRRRKGIDTGEVAVDEQSARLEEFVSLSDNCPRKPHEIEPPEFENRTFQPMPDLTEWVDLVAAVERLREVRSYCGFTRIDPKWVPVEDISDALHERRICRLSGQDKDWLPAVEVRGEGIFFRLNEKTLAQWEKQLLVQQRAEAIHKVHLAVANQQGRQVHWTISPRLLLVHSLSHTILRRLSLDCGYSTASLRERLFVSEPGDQKPIAGFLIYTASPDSDGSFGGLVAMATPERISETIRRAIEDAAWCGNDPVCIEADPRSRGERLSGASCHNCLLAPETACERFNHELDRVMLIGNKVSGIVAPVPGFFEGLLEDGHL